MLRHALNRPALPLFTIAAIILLAGLLIAGLGHTDRRVYTADVQSSNPIITLTPHHRTCEGPITPSSSFEAVGVFLNPPLGSASVRVDVQTHRTHHILASAIQITDAEAEFILPLNNLVAGGQPIDVCIRGLIGTTQVLGDTSLSPSMSLLHQSNAAFALALINQHQSLLSALPTAFSRAALFKLSWMGSWTFWILAALLLATLGVAGYALASADDEDDASNN